MVDASDGVLLAGTQAASSQMEAKEINGRRAGEASGVRKKQCGAEKKRRLLIIVDGNGPISSSLNM